MDLRGTKYEKTGLIVQTIRCGLVERERESWLTVWPFNLSFVWLREQSSRTIDLLDVTGALDEDSLGCGLFVGRDYPVQSTVTRLWLVVTSWIVERQTIDTSGLLRGSELSYEIAFSLWRAGDVLARLTLGTIRLAFLWIEHTNLSGGGAFSW